MENSGRITRATANRGVKRSTEVRQRRTLKDVGNRPDSIVARPTAKKSEQSTKKNDPQPKRRRVSERKSKTDNAKSCPVLPTHTIESRIPELPVFNIDQDDTDDPQSVTYYVDDIYQYMRQLENDYYPRKRPDLEEKMIQMRHVLIDWLIEVHVQFKFGIETLYLTVSILDRYIHAKAPIIRRRIVQLVGITAMFLASKCEEIYPPEVFDFVYISDNTYTDCQIRDMEKHMLVTINFNMSPPLLIHFLRRHSKAGQVEAKVHTLAKYVLECSLLDYNLSGLLPSLLSSGALAYSLMVFNEDEELDTLWTPTLAYYSRYQKTVLSDLVTRLSHMMSRISSKPKDAKLMCVRKKFCHSSYNRIAELPRLTQLF